MTESKTKLVPCSKCGAPVLPNLAECMFCGQTNPGRMASNPLGRRIVDWQQDRRKQTRARQSAPQASVDWRGLLGRYQHYFTGAEAVTYTIIAVNVGLYLLALLIDLRGVTWFQGLFGIAMPSGRALWTMGASGPLLTFGRPWTLLTAFYLNGSLFGVAISCVWLYSIGRMVERFWGSAAFYLLFVIAGTTGTFAASLLDPSILITPNAALFGLFAALIVFGRSTFDSFGEQIVRQSAVLAVILLLFDLLGPIHYLIADVAGFAAAFAFATWLRNNPRMRYDPLIDRIARILALSTGALIVVTAFVVTLGRISVG